MDNSTIFDQTTSLSNNPNNHTVTDQKQLFSHFLEKFLVENDKAQKIYHHGADTIRVSEVLGSIAFLYEKIRNVVEYKGEHVLRRNAIERILKRLLWEHAGHDTGRISRVLLRELIWARYLPNDVVPKSKVSEIKKILDKYIYFLAALGVKNSGSALTIHRRWLWGVASCEIEEKLDPSNREPYIRLMFSWFKTYYHWVDDDLPDAQKDTQIYLAIHRSLAKSDEEIMRYHLLIKYFPQWESADPQVMQKIAENFYSTYQEIEKHLDFSEKFKLYRLIQKQTAPFDVFKNLVTQEKTNLRNILINPQKLDAKIHEICQVKYSQIQKKVNRGILRSVIYIFLTKVVLAMLIEIPYELYRFNALNYIPLGINIVIPPAMMWLVGLTIKVPNEANTQRILTKLKSMIYENPDPRPVNYSLKRNTDVSIMTQIFTFVYLLLFILVFGGITLLLLKLHFDVVGIFIFFIFLSLVLLFGFRVRFTSSELKVTSDKEGFFGYIFNNLTMPFLSTGVYLSKGLAKINFLSVILDFLIEAPLKSIIEVIEEWTSFVREKREEVVEVPEQ